MTLCLLLLLWPLAAATQDIAPNLTRFRRFGTEHGLSQASGWSVVQDRHGFVWIGTQDGLNRFDGNEFRVYRHDPAAPDSLAGNRISALAIDHDGTLWVASNGGLSRYLAELDRFETIPVAAEEAAAGELRALHVDAQGVLWVGGYAGLSRLDPRVGQHRRWAFDAANRPADLRIESLASDADGRLWIGTLAGLARLDPASGRVDWPFRGLPSAAPLDDTRIDTLLVDREGVLWIGAVAAGLFRYDSAQGELRVFRHVADDPNSLNSDLIRSLLQDRQGGLWVGTREGLNLLTAPHDPATRILRYTHHRHDPRSLGSGRVMSLFQAADGSLLIGTYTGGLSVLHARGNRFASFTPDSAASARLRDPVIYSALPAGPAAVWLGGRKGLYHFDLATGQMQDYPATAGLGISALAADGATLWLGVLAGALRFDAADGSLQRLKLPAPLPGVQITRIFHDGDRLFVGTFDRGLFVLRRDGHELVAHYPIASWVSQIVIFDEDTVLICASDGLHWLSRDGSEQRWQHRAGSDGSTPLRNGITYFHRAADGRMWLASAGDGLWEMQLAPGERLADARFTAVPAVRELGLDVVQAIAEDRRGLLWLSTSRGIARFDPDRGDASLYGGADGAFDSDYSSAAVARLDDGRLVFTATRGFTVFDPMRIGETPDAAAPLLTELRVWNRRMEVKAIDPRSPLQSPLHLSERLQIPAETARMLSLRFASVELIAPERLRYAYRLDGFDRGWIEVPASERQATYTNLPPGAYVFRVKAGEPGTLADALETRLALDILPPWWMTPWARLSFTAGLLLALYLGYRWRVRSIQAHRRLLQQQVSERTAQLSQEKQRAELALQELKQAQRGLVEAEKMASLGQLVAGVAHEINTPIGVALTASSTLSERSGEMLRKFEEGTLRRSELGGFLGVACEASQMVDHNLHRAAELVRSFKQVAVDRSSDERRQFELGDYLDTLFKSLSASWRQRAIEFTLDCPPGIWLEGYPGTFAQILGNFVQNALLHAFEPEQPGHLRLTVQTLPGDHVELRFADDGRGIAADALPHVFEPFYTTRRGQGGTGLGLHVVYNLVNARLGGLIEVRSTPGQGTCFIVRFPRVAP